MTTYFSDASFKFLRALARHNDKTWFNDHRHQYEAHVRQPFLQLITDLQPALAQVSEHYRADPKTQGGSLFRIYRDARFPTTNHRTRTGKARACSMSAAARCRRRRSTSICSRARASWVRGCGIRSRTQRKLRQFIFDNPANWKAAAYEPKLRRKFALDDSEKLVRAPRGFPNDFEFIDDLKHRNWAYLRPLDDAIMTGPRLRQTIEADLVVLAPFVDYLCAALDLEF